MTVSVKSLLATLMLTFILAGVVSAQPPNIVSVSPAANGIGAIASTNIVVVFDADIADSTINSSTFSVLGRFTGFRTGTFSYDAPTKTVTFNPDNDFLSGELMTVIATTNITSPASDPLAKPYEWSFTTAVSPSNVNYPISVTYDVGDAPHDIFSADLDKDGDLDLVTANYISDNISILMNSGSGIFDSAINYPAGDGIRSVAAADVDRDGDLDLISADGDAHTLSVMLNHGSGIFAAPVSYGTGIAPHYVVAADLDGDGDLDLATSNYQSASVSVLKNNGDGTFAVKVDNAVGANPIGLCAADLDEDDDIDLVSANQSGSISVLLNNSSGSFAAHADYQADSIFSAGSRSVVAGDLNSDGHLDLATANRYTDDISVFIGSGDGTFPSLIKYHSGSEPYFVTAADLDGDNYLEMISSNLSGNNLSVFLNSGFGIYDSTFGLLAGTGPIPITAADYNADGKLDLAAGNFFSDNISVYLSQPDGAGSDSLVLPSISVLPCNNRCVVVQPALTKLTQPIKGASIPIEVPPGLAICSVSTQGTVIEDWDIVVIDDDKWDDSGFVFVVFANSFGDLVPAGVTTVFRIYFTATALCNTNYYVRWDTALSNDPSRQLLFSDTANQLIFPKFSKFSHFAEIKGYVPGDFDASGMLNIIDLTAFVDGLFRGGIPACQVNAGDNNADCHGPNIADLTYLVEYLFRHGAGPKCGCILS